MPKRRVDGELDVIKARIETSLGQRADFRGQQQRLGATGTASKTQVLVCDWNRCVGLWMRGEHETDSVIFDMRGDRDLPDEFLQFKQGCSIENFFHLCFRALGCAIQHFGQLGSARVTDQKFKEEAVELRFGQWVSAFLVNWILRCQNEKWLG